ncbi:MAG TPA: hypothetical protein DCW29_01295 [Janthinobacterium sp.]|nr:hypothetical protein [Janthinobacterium sp.]
MRGLSFVKEKVAKIAQKCGILPRPPAAWKKTRKPSPKNTVPASLGGESVVNKNSEKIAAARFAMLGASIYPDATFTLRLSYGEIKGWKQGGQEVPPFTDFGGAFEHATGAAPFKLPPSWEAAKARLALATPLNFVSGKDIVGGNSGSTVINRDGQLVGLIFDGSIHSLGGAFGYDPSNNRAVAVDSAAPLEALDKIDGAQDLTRELRGDGAH